MWRMRWTGRAVSSLRLCTSGAKPDIAGCWGENLTLSWSHVSMVITWIVVEKKVGYSEEVKFETETGSAREVSAGSRPDSEVRGPGDDASFLIWTDKW